VEAQLDLARGYLEQGDLNRARPPLEKALQIDPQHVEALVLGAVLFHAENEYELAEQYYQRALDIEPGNAQALNNYGTFLYSRGRYRDALVPLSRLVRDTSYRSRSQAFENLGMAYLRADDEAEAEAAFLRSLELNFRQAGATLELAELAYGRGEYEAAASRLMEFKTMARQSARSLCLALKVAQATGDNDQAASNELALNNLFPDQAGQCRTRS
jgi:type IV pilus assembly protein PilF